jgi:two-component system, NarL family, sensor histidine kinase UhpB
MFKDKRAVNILVIEDNAGDYLLIEDYLSEKFEAPSITNAKTFSAAKEMLTNQHAGFDIILLDLSLSDKHGEELITEIGAISKQSIIIVLTGFSDIAFSVKSLAIGVSDYLLKDDINATALYKSIVYNIERRKTNLQLAESEIRFSNLFQLSPQPMWVFEPQTLKFVQVNLAAIQHYGYTEQEFLSLTILDIRPEDEVQKVKEAMNSRDTLALSTVANRFRHRKKSGELIDVEIYSSPITLDNKLYRSVISIDVTEKVQTDHKLTKAIIKTQEDERYEIGSELHDNVCQLLATSQMLMGMLKNSIEPSAVKIFEQCKEYISLALDDVRNVSHRLAPAFYEDAAMKDTFEMLINNFNVGNRFQIYTEFGESLKSESPGREVQLNLYRILQEQLRNILKYSQARSISVAMDIKNGDLCMRISDDGVGFDVSAVKVGIGISNMKRRAELFSGSLKIRSSPGAGCTISVNIPLKNIYALNTT